MMDLSKGGTLTAEMMPGVRGGNRLQKAESAYGKMKLSRGQTSGQKTKEDFTMNAMLLKLAPRIPELVARALAGDPSAAALLAVMGVAAGVEAVRRNR